MRRFSSSKVFVLNILCAQLLIIYLFHKTDHLQLCSRLVLTVVHLLERQAVWQSW